MGEILALEQYPEAPLDATAIRSRFEQLSVLRQGGQEDPAAAAAETADGLQGLREAYLAVDAWDSSADALPSDGLDAYLEWLRKEVGLAEEENCKLSAEIDATGETVLKDAIQLDADMGVLESSLNKIDSEGWKHLEANPIIGLSVSTDACRKEANVEASKFEALELDHQIEKSEMELKLLEDLNNSMESAETVWQLRSMFSETHLLDFKDNCLRVFLKAPILTSECVIYGQKLGYDVGSVVLDHELLIEVDEGTMELKKVQVLPDDVCVDVLLEKFRSCRHVISATSLGWLIRQFQQHIIINSLRRSLITDANNSRHIFKYCDKDETIVAQMVCGIDAFIKISADWPLSSYGLKLISIRNSGTESANITLNLLCRTKELANDLELQTRRHLVRFVDAIEEILLREGQSELHSSSSSG